MSATEPGGFDLAGKAGSIEAMLTREPGEPSFVAVVCHPHPLYGGDMKNKVTHALAAVISGSGGAAFRFNFRGVGRSEGEHDKGKGETDDLATVVDHAEQVFPDRPLLLCGYSFGAWVSLRYGASKPTVRAMVGVGLAISIHGFDEAARSTHPRLVVQGDRDPFGAIDRVRTMVDDWSPPTDLVVIDGADHFFAPGLDDVRHAVTEFIAKIMNDGAAQ